MRKPCLDCRQLTRNGNRCENCAKSFTKKRAAQRLVFEPWRKIYLTPQWGKAKRDCFDRDNWQCRALIDGKRCENTEDLQAHHMVPLEELWRTGGNPYRVSNLATLCPMCHARADAIRRKNRETNDHVL